MKYIPIKICLVIIALFGGVAAASDLPDCPTSAEIRWHNCFGTFTWSNGNKYVGEYKDSKRTGQGTYTHADGTVEEGIWKDDEFLGTAAELEIAEKKRIAKEKQEELARQEKKHKYDRIYNACLLDKGSDVDMQVSSLERAVKDTCKSIAKKPSWFESMKYD